MRTTGPLAGERTVPVAFLRSALRAAERAGIDVDAVLADAAIAPGPIADDRARLGPEQVTAFARALWRHSDDETIGMGRAPVPRGSFHLLCHALVGAPDLRELYARLAAFGPALPGLPGVRLDVGVSRTRVTLDLTGAHDPDHLLADFALVVLHRFTGWLVGRRIRLHAVELPYPHPPAAAWAAEYDLIFGAPLIFDAAAPALVLDTAVLDRPVVRTGDELVEYLRHSPADLLARRDYGTTLADRVRRLLAHELRATRPTGAWDADALAARVGLSPQHLRRRLREEGTSVTVIRTELARDYAVNALTRGEPVEAVSAALGFSEPSAFRRAFRRWTGVTPAAYRPRSDGG